MKAFIYWLGDKLMEEKVSNVICYSVIAIAALYFIIRISVGLIFHV
jgi:hypothetical protein